MRLFETYGESVYVVTRDESFYLLTEAAEITPPGARPGARAAGTNIDRFAVNSLYLLSDECMHRY